MYCSFDAAVDRSQDAQEMHSSTLADAGSSMMTVKLPKAISQVVDSETDVDHLFLVSMK